MAKILVTGGTGYIGSHTVVALIEAGYEVLVVDDLSNSNASILNQIQKITGKKPSFFNFDLSNKQLVDAFAKEQTNITGIIHFAAFKAVGESVSEPLKYYKNNIFSLINLLQAFGDTNIVFSSSCTVYGQPEILPVTENSPIQAALSPYGNTKQIGEEILKDTAAATAGLNCIALRYFNPVGAHASGLIGELPNGVPQNLVPFITRSAIGKLDPITVYGNDYDTPDGSAIRDYIHVVDVANAHVAAIKRLEEKGQKSNYEVFNIGTGTGYSVLEIIAAFKKATGVDAKYKIGPRRAGDIEKVYGDVTNAAAELNWKAELTLEEMMGSAWKWEKNLSDPAFEDVIVQ